MFTVIFFTNRNIRLHCPNMHSMDYYTTLRNKGGQINMDYEQSLLNINLKIEYKIIHIP